MSLAQKLEKKVEGELIGTTVSESWIRVTDWQHMSIFSEPRAIERLAYFYIYQRTKTKSINVNEAVSFHEFLRIP